MRNSIRTEELLTNRNSCKNSPRSERRWSRAKPPSGRSTISTLRWADRSKSFPTGWAFGAARFARRGRHADAASTAERLAALEPASGANLYQAAQGYALCAAGMKPAKPQTQLSAEEQALRDRYSARAVELLKQSDAAGYFKDPEQPRHSNETATWNALRSRDDFKKLRRQNPSVIGREKVNCGVRTLRQLEIIGQRRACE